ncbi:Protein N-acetyltransferase, RimJ/RimL family [Actinacidiphila yanglinensis]|uniref:Protein N-acetyltransferase, RimJ/RimL family n=1 Tax=Actinacidiphila yanglinensis TaxID=310779 RepID=A0A1H6E9G1_9ACTN|nr:GNAT family protein [Actinacidiphila yanglinensis]SEG94400.1 Protein N-acetyltransferase, RimJ/RimL family [Actinacidiphila yanglinensis]
MASPRGAALGTPTILHAHGLVLRPVTAADEPAVAQAMTDPGVLQWAAGMAVLDAPPKDRATVWLSARIGAWSTGTAAFAVTDPADGIMIGYLGLRDVHRIPDQAIAGYWVTPSARGRGITARALDAAASWAFTSAHRGGLGVHRIVLDHVLDNPGSCRAALRAGFAEEGVMREAFIARDGVRHDCHLHARLATDPAARPFT